MITIALEQVDARQMLGALLVIAGLIIANWRSEGSGQDNEALRG
jgi:drug/metabolite transporter (DMT)-like permease